MIGSMNAATSSCGLLEAGDPRGEVRMTWHAKETVRSLYRIGDPDHAAAFLDELICDMADRDMPIEVRSLAHTLKRWRSQILAWHRYRIRALLYAGAPNWDLFTTITPR